MSCGDRCLAGQLMRRPVFGELRTPPDLQIRGSCRHPMHSVDERYDVQDWLRGAILAIVECTCVGVFSASGKAAMTHHARAPHTCTPVTTPQTLSNHIADASLVDHAWCSSFERPRSRSPLSIRVWPASRCQPSPWQARTRPASTLPTPHSCPRSAPWMSGTPAV